MTKTVYMFDELTGLYMGVYFAPASPMEPGKYLEPTFSTVVDLPAEVPEKTRHFVGGAWEYRDVPPLAEPEVEPTPAQQRRAEILEELAQIDIDSVRPARAVALAMATGEVPHEQDIDMLALHESRAIALRADLAALDE